MKLSKLITLLFFLAIFGCSPRWTKYSWGGLKEKKDFCLLENSVSAEKDSIGKLKATGSIDTVKWSEHICYFRQKNDEFVISFFKDDSLTSRLIKRKDGLRKWNLLDVNSLNDTIYYGTVYLTRFGSIQKTFNSSNRLALIDTSRFDIKNKQMSSTTAFFQKDTANIMRTNTYFDYLFRPKKVEIFNAKGEIEQVYSYNYLCKDNNCSIDTVFRTHNINESDFYEMVLTKKIYK